MCEDEKVLLGQVGKITEIHDFTMEKMSSLCWIINFHNCRPMEFKHIY